MYKIKDHNVARKNNRTDLLKFLSSRIQELNREAKANFLDGLQRMKLSAHPLAETIAKDIILSTREDELSRLKSKTDTKGDVNSMHKLVYTDIRSPLIRGKILDHIQKQAKSQQSLGITNGRRGKERRKFAWHKVLSDIDDTLYCSFGLEHYIAGVDRSYPKKVIYPVMLFIDITVFFSILFP